MTGRDLVDEKLHQLEVIDFHFEEAELLDDNDFRGWYETMLTDDVVYQMPVRVSREKDAPSEFSEQSYHFDEDRASLEGRVARFETEYAWAENPPTRTRRIVSNTRVKDDDGEELAVKSNILLYRAAQSDSLKSDQLFAERFDTLRRVDGDLKLAKRLVHLDHTTLDTRPLTTFL